MSMRAKMRLQDVIPNTWGGRKVFFSCEYDPSIPEDQKFTKATPTGECTMTIDNPAASSQLVIGKSYYVDFTQAD